jgi:viroplasmin and RNaseH domain-containing protein
VCYGRVPGVYKSWEDCNPQLTGYKYNLHKGCKTIEDAEKAHSEFLSQQPRNYLAQKIAACGAPKIAARGGSIGSRTSSSTV